jgi:hypothetical protein
MSIDIPSGRPNRGFIRYVRPPLKDSDTEPLYPLRPSTRPLRLGIDVATIPEPPEGWIQLIVATPRSGGVWMGRPRGRVASSVDNTMIESFWSTMQRELLDTHRWDTKAQLSQAIFE